MPVIEDKSLALHVKPESIISFRNQLADEAIAGIQQDIPGIQFGAVPAQTAAPSAELSPPPADVQPQWETLSFQPQAAPPAAPAPQQKPAEERGFWSNLARRVGNRAGTILTDVFFDTANTIGDILPDWANAGIVFDDKGIRFVTGKEYDKHSFVANVADVLNDPSYQIIENKDTVTPDQIKADYRTGDKTKLAKDIAVYAFEQGVTSVPDMIGIVAAAPAYFTGLASDYTQQRVQNDGRDKAKMSDVAIGTGTALVVAALERFGAERVLGAVLKGDKGALRRFLESVAAETATEAAQNPAEFMGTRVGTQAQGQITSANLRDQALFGAIGGLGGAVAVGGPVHLAEAAMHRGAAPAPGAAVPPQNPPSPPPNAAPTPQAPTGSPPNVAPMPMAAATPPAAPQPRSAGAVSTGSVALYQPEGAAGPTPVRVEEVDPASGTARVTSLDENGEPLIVDGEPATYVVQLSDLKIGARRPTPKPAAAGAAKPATSATPAPAAPAATAAPANAAGTVDQPTAEPLKDISAQIADMKDPAKPRQAVFLSHENVKNLNQQKLLGKVKEMGVPVVNFDYKGGLMLFPDQATADRAKEARKGKKARELQALIGHLTGSGQEKPVGPGVVVQQKTPEGAVARETLVSPENVPAATQQLSEPGRTVEVTTTEQALQRRAEGVAAEQNAQFSQNLEAARAETNTQPTERQKEAGNYAKGEIDFGGMKIAIENPKGSTRSGKDSAGKPWSQVMQHDYGYVKSTKGADGDAVDVFLTGKPDTGRVYVIHQNNADGTFDEYKAVLGASSKEEAVSTYLSNYAAGWESRIGKVDQMTTADFRERAEKGDFKKAPTQAAPKARAASTLDQLGAAMIFLQEQEKVPAGKKHARPLEERQQNAAQFAAVLQAAAHEAQKRGAPDEIVAAAREAARGATHFAEKSEYATRKGQGTGHARVTSKINDMLKAAEALRKYATESPAKPAESKPAATTSNVVDITDRLEERESDELIATLRDMRIDSDLADIDDLAQKYETVKKKVPENERDETSDRDIREALDSLQSLNPKDRRAVEGAVALLKKRLTDGIKAMEWNLQRISRPGYDPSRDRVWRPAAESKPAPKPAAPKRRIVVTPEMKSRAYVAEEAKKLEAEARPVLEVKPRAATGQEIKSLLEDLGIDTAALVEQARQAGGSKRSARGALANQIREFLPDFNKEGGWLQYIAALKPLMQENKNFELRMRKLLERYTHADKEQLDAAREALVEYLQDIDGKRLDPKAIEAVVEYANFRRAYAAVRESLDELTSEDIGETVNDWGQTQEDENDYIQEFDDGRYLLPDFEAMQKIGRAWGPAFDAFKANNFHETLITQYRDKENYLSTHDFLRQFIENLRQQNNPRLDYIILLTNRLLRRVPDLPIKIVSEVKGRNGKLLNAAGLMDAGNNVIQVKIRDQLNPRQLQTFLHEIVHAATLYELRANPNGQLARQLEDVRILALQAARRRYGDVLDGWMRYFADPSGQVAKPTGPDLRDLYGLLNTPEMVAEALTNPRFQQILSELTPFTSGQQSGTRPLSILRRLFRRIADWLGVKNPRESWLLEEVLNLSLRTIDSQAQTARNARAKERFDRAVRSLMEFAGIPEEEAMKRLTELVGDKVAHLVNAYEGGTLFASGRTVPIGRATIDFMSGEFYAPDYTEGPPMRQETRLRAIAGDALTNIARATRNFSKSRAVEKLKQGFLSLYAFDQIERRMSRFFAGPNDPANPLTRLMDVRRRRTTHANTVLERAERDVNSKWLKLDSEQNRRLGQFMIDSTLWGIDPTKPKADHPSKVRKRKTFHAKYDEFQTRWRQMSQAERDVYTAARDYNTYLFNKIRRAAVDLALDGFSEQEIPKAQRALLYSLRDPAEVDALVGDGKLIDVGEMNESFAAALKDVMRLTRIEGPYFTLRRYGNWVVQADREGEDTYDSEDAALARVQEIKGMTPKNTATVRQDGDKFVVQYKMHYVAFHKSKIDAETDANQLRARGFKVPAVTRKSISTANTALTPALKEMVARAKRKIGADGSRPADAAVMFALDNAFAQILAERAASIASEQKREGFVGVKPEEMHIGFAERTHSSAWHYANLITAKDEVRALANLRNYARDPQLGNADQETMYARGEVVEEVEKRLAKEAIDFGMNNPLESAIAKVGFANYLATPSYAFINATQNFTVAMPVIGARFGYGKTARAFGRAMRAVAGPAFGKALSGLAKKPGALTSYDIYQAIADAVKDDPRLARWVKGDNSAIQQLVDLGVINASFTQELISVAQSENRAVRKSMEYMRLLPQGAEMFNRISTALALLELTNGNVAKTADLVRLTQIDYSWANQPRAFKMLPAAKTITMFKMYPQAIYNLLISSTYDAITGNGGSRAEAAKTLAGILASHTLAAGVIGGLLVEPLRLLMWAWNQIFGSDDEPYDPDTAVRLFMAEAFGEWWGGVASRGLPQALGVDLSTRMGLNHLLFYNPPDLTKADANQWYKAIFEALGPVPAYLVNSHTQFLKAWEQGRIRDAFLSIVPIKIVQDANKAWNMVTGGLTSSTGEPIIPAEEINAAEGVARFLGFRTRTESDLADKQSTKFNYEGWLKDRKGELYAAYRRAETRDEKDKVIAQMKEFNAKNPGAKITMGDLIRSQRTARRQAKELSGEAVRNKDLRERLAY